MEIKISGKTVNIINDHDPDIHELIKVCETLINRLYLATLLCKHKKLEGEGSELPLEYNKSYLIANVISDLYFSTARTASTVIKLNKLDSSSLVQAVIIVRGILETCINASFIMSMGDEAAKNAVEHALAKSFTDHDKTIGSGKHSISIKSSFLPKPSENFQKLLKKFTSKKGRQLNWIDLSVSQRIVEIEKRFGKTIAIGLNSAYTALYQDASEMIHGSYLGALISLGREPLSNPTKDMKEINKKDEQKYSYSLSCMFLSIYYSLKSFSNFAEIDENRFSLDLLFERFFEVMYGESTTEYLQKNPKVDGTH